MSDPRPGGTDGGELRFGDSPDGGELRFTVDGDPVSYHDGGSRARSNQQPRPPSGRPIGRVWCAAVASVALLLSLLALNHYHQRQRPVVITTVTRPGGLATADLTGCPVSAACVFRPDGDSPLLPVLQRHLPQVKVLHTELVFDSTTAANYRAVLVAMLAPGLVISVEADYRPVGPDPASWNSAPVGTGPADLVLQRHGPRRGSSVSITAHVPAGTAVPNAALAAVVDDPAAQLQP